MQVHNISVLCVDHNSNYKSYPGLDVWDKKRDVYNFNSKNKVIAHAPCQQWSKSRNLAHKNHDELNLAFFCWNIIQINGGIFEHPLGSSFFKYVDTSQGKLIRVNQSQFGFPAPKPTLLYFHKCSPVSEPLNFNCVTKNVKDLHSSQRSRSTVAFINWLLLCLRD